MEVLRHALNRALRVIAFGLLLGGTYLPNARASDSNPVELAVKATYLYKFAPFVTWPHNTFSSPLDSFNLCIVGSDPFGALLDKAVEGQHVAEHEIAVKRMPVATSDDHCQMIYIGATDEPTLMQQRAAVQGLPVVTVTDSVDEPAAKGMINFVVADNRVRFEIDNDAALRAGLVISSKLLNLAISARPTP